jgi:hypothetical protein
LGKKKKRALYEMEQHRLVGDLRVVVRGYDADGNPKGKPFDLGTDKKNELVYDRVWIHPLGLPWGDFRCTVTEQNARALWPPRLPASQTAPDQQPEDKAGPDPLNSDHPSAVQSSQDKSKREGRQVRRVREVLREFLFPPDGRPPDDVPVKTVQTDVNKIFDARSWKLASRDTVARAMGRRRA